MGGTHSVMPRAASAPLKESTPFPSRHPVLTGEHTVTPGTHPVMPKAASAPLKESIPFPSRHTVLSDEHIFTSGAHTVTPRAATAPLKESTFFPKGHTVLFWESKFPSLSLLKFSPPFEKPLDLLTSLLSKNEPFLKTLTSSSQQP